MFCDPDSTHYHSEVLFPSLSLKSNLNLIEPPDLNSNTEKKSKGSFYMEKMGKWGKLFKKNNTFLFNKYNEFDLNVHVDGNV